NSAPRANREKTKNGIHIYKNNRNVNRKNAKKGVMTVHIPLAFSRVGKKGKLGKADEMYEEFISIYQDTNVERGEGLTGIKKELPAEGGAIHAGKEARSRQGSLTARRGGRETH
ncbi:MAG: hypothetical protein ACKO96_46195, partial [Flammeovirgaceae bacterium]